MPGSNVAVYGNLFILTLPAALLIVSFSLTLLTIYTPQFAVADLYVPLPNDTNTVVLSSKYQHARSPFYTCRDIGIEETGKLNQSCHRWNSVHGSCSPYTAPDNPQLCQNIFLSGNLLIASAVFIGLSMVLSFIVLFIGFPLYRSGTVGDVSYIPVATTDRSDHHHHHRQHETSKEGNPQRRTTTLLTLVTTPTVLFTLIGLLMLILAQILGVNALVNEQPPSADWASSTTPVPPSAQTPLDNTTGPWMMGKGSLIYLTTAWVAAGASFWIAQLGWVLPRMGST